MECCCCTKKMSSSSSEADVEESLMSDTSYNEEQQKTVTDVLNHCQKSKSLGYAYKNYNYLLSRKIRLQKMKKKDRPSSFSYPESYSPTLPVERPRNDSSSYPVGTPYHSEEGSPPRDPESSFQEQERSLSPTHPSTYSPHSYEPYYQPDDPVQGSSSMLCYSSPVAHSTHNISPTRASAAASRSTLGQGEPGPAHNPEMITYPPLMENNSLGHTASSLCIPPSYATGSPGVTNPGIIKQSFSHDPSTWSVEEVIQFLKHTDPQTLTPIANLFRQHDIDGKALLLLKSDMMMKYMGLKLGTAVKLCHYIDRLKEEKFCDN